MTKKKICRICKSPSGKRSVCGVCKAKHPYKASAPGQRPFNRQELGSKGVLSKNKEE